MTNITEHVIDSDGRWYRRSVRIDEIEPTEAIIKASSSNAMQKLPAILNLPGHGSVSVAATPDGKYQYWTVPITTIKLKCPFKPYETPNGPRMSPDFAGKGPQLTIDWDLNEAFPKEKERPRIIFLARMIVYQTDKSEPASVVEKQYLYAFSKEGNAWRLPLSNLFETCELCNGDYDSTASHSFESVQKALIQFRDASWNKDLTNLTLPELTEKFFRFKPLEKGFQTMPVETKWTELCDKISTAELKYVVL